MTMLGRYAVIGPLGSGGMSQINLARAQNGDLVVLKQQLREEDDDYLIDEGTLGIRLKHPNLVKTIELFEVDGRPILASEYVPGVSLAALVAAGPLPPASVCDIGAQVADALDSIHRAVDTRGNPLNILHRDVTPNNILVGFDGRARLIDLGIARYVNSMAPMTKVGDLRGTLHYLAPEVVSGGLHSRASDLWSLGVSLFEAAMGRVAVERADLASVMDAITNQRVLHLRPGETLDVRIRHVLATLVNPEARCRPEYASDAASILRIHAAEHDDAASETVKRVALLLGRPAQTRLDDVKDKRAATSLIQQAELLFGTTNPSDVNAAPSPATPPSVEPSPSAESFELPPIDDDGEPPMPVYQGEALDPFAFAGPASAASGFEDSERTRQVDEYKIPALAMPPSLPQPAMPQPSMPQPSMPPIPRFEELHLDDDTLERTDAKNIPRPISMLEEEANLDDRVSSSVVGSLSPSDALGKKELLSSSAPRPEDALPTREVSPEVLPEVLPEIGDEEEDPTMVAHPEILKDLAKKSVQVSAPIIPLASPATGNAKALVEVESPAAGPQEQSDRTEASAGDSVETELPPQAADARSRGEKTLPLVRNPALPASGPPIPASSASGGITAAAVGVGDASVVPSRAAAELFGEQPATVIDDGSSLDSLSDSQPDEFLEELPPGSAPALALDTLAASTPKQEKGPLIPTEAVDRRRTSPTEEVGPRAWSGTRLLWVALPSVMGTAALAFVGGFLLARL